MSYTKEQVEAAVLSKDYSYFTNGDYNVNIVGIRNSDTCDRVTNHYDDWMTLSYKINGEWKYHVWPITTDPGLYWMDHPLNNDGCAILVPNQYKGVYKIDGHGRSRYTALCQRLGSVKVYRDGDKDDIYDFNSATIDEGKFGINIHRSSAYNTTTEINKYSAGCQVFSNPDDFKVFMRIIKKSADEWGNKFTYTLIESKDIE